MGTQPFEIPDDFRAFMKHVVEVLAQPEDKRFLDAEDALQHECGYGGRVDHGDQFRFCYITKDGLYKWELLLREPAIHNIADGLCIEVDGTRNELLRTKHRERTGTPLLIWGEYGDDALRVRDTRELILALDHLHTSTLESGPRLLRMWSPADDQVIAIMHGHMCAIYVVESLEGYATSVGDPARTDSFEIVDHDGGRMLVPWSDCVPWERARNALIRFMEAGDLGPEIMSEGRIPSMLLMMGDVDRKAALAARSEAPRELTRSSLPRMVTPVPEETQDEPTSPHGAEREAPPKGEALFAWARRLIDLLCSRELLELTAPNLNIEELSYQLGSLLQAHGSEAQHSLETADWLANEIGTVRGVKQLFATGGDLQIALRRSRAAV